MAGLDVDSNFSLVPIRVTVDNDSSIYVFLCIKELASMRLNLLIATSCVLFALRFSDPIDVKMTRNGHPVVIASKGSHGFWTRQGIHTYKTIANGEKLNDLASSGVNWDTWRNMKLIIFQKNPKQNPYSGSLTWLNYNGDWGNKKRGCVGGKRYIKMPHKTYVVKMKEICSLNGGPSSLNQRSEMQHYFPLA